MSSDTQDDALKLNKLLRKLQDKFDNEIGSKSIKSSML